MRQYTLPGVLNYRARLRLLLTAFTPPTVLACLALVLSALTVFYNFFYVRRSVDAHILSVTYVDEIVVAEMAFVNTGNRSAAVIDAMILPWNVQGEGGWALFSPESLAPLRIAKTSFERTVLEPRQVKFVTFKQPMPAPMAATVHSMKVGDAFHSILGITLVVLDDAGTTYRNTHFMNTFYSRWSPDGALRTMVLGEFVRRFPLLNNDVDDHEDLARLAGESRVGSDIQPLIDFK
jgi:hypothetical protein